MIVVPRTLTGRGEAQHDPTTARTSSLLDGFRQLAKPQVFSTVGLLALATVVLATSLESVSGPFVVGGYSGYNPVHLALTVAAWPVMATLSSLLLRADWGAHRGTLVVGAALIGLGLMWMAFADSWIYGLIGFALAGSGNGVINISLSAAIWGGVPSAMQRAAWSAFNFMLAVMLIIGFVVGSTAGAGQAPRVVFVGGALSLAVNTVYLFVLRVRRRTSDLGLASCEPP